MEIYKTLPIDPWRICASQLMVQVTLGYVIALTIIISALVFDESITLPRALGLAAFALPFTFLIYAVENTLHLLFPTKLVAMGRADFEFLGRSIVEFLAKTAFIFGAVTAAIYVGITFRLTGSMWIVPGVTAWITLTMIGYLTMAAMQYAFRRFEVAENID